MHGICHVEIPCRDFEKTGKFYSAVFGWKVETAPGMDYAMFQTPEGVGGGFSKQAKITAEPGVFIYIEVEDIKAALVKIEENGGRKITGRTQISPEFGYFGVFEDVEGNAIGLWSRG